MASRHPYELIYAPAIKAHLRVIDRKYHALISETIESLLRFEPQRENRNRKPLLRPLFMDADWELRLGPGNRFRVLYAVDRTEHTVTVLAVGVKERNILLVGGEEVQL